MAEQGSAREEIPARLVEVLERQDDRTLVAIRAYCDELIDESQLEESFDERSF